MKEGNAIEVHDITKTFKVYLDRSNDIKSFMLHGNRRKYEKRQVLKGLSFEVKKGEAIGLIGHNGCGKSTTLKLLTRIMYPDSGSIEIKGRVSSLIELGAGFHPDMSGRENIYINASIFGLSKREIDERLDDIIAFSELEEFIDNPVRTYSSGMYMRLAFSVAINVDADVILIDEILAVGDVAFQAKCFNKLKEIKGKGTTIVIVSHSLGQIEEICECSIWIDQGIIREKGCPKKIHQQYLKYMSQYTMSPEDEESDEQADAIEEQADAIEEQKPVDEKVPEVQITRVVMYDSEHNIKKSYVTGESATIVFDYVAIDEEHEKASIELVIIRNDGLETYETNTFREGFPLMSFNGKGTVKCYIDKLNLITGEYQIDLAIRRPNAFPFHYYEKAVKFKITSIDQERGIAKIDHTWDMGALLDEKSD